MKRGLVRQFGLIGREEKVVSHGVVLIGGLALVITGLLRLVS